MEVESLSDQDHQQIKQGLITSQTNPYIPQSFLLLDDHLILNIYSFLWLPESRNLAQAMFSSKQLLPCIQSDQFFKILCNTCLFENPELIVETKPQSITYREYFMENLNRSQFYQQIFSSIVSKQLSLSQGEYESLQQQKPYVNDHQKVSMIKEIIRQSYKRLSKDIVILYRVLNGQQELVEQGLSHYEHLPLFGMYHFSYREYSHYFAPLTPPLCGFLQYFQALYFLQVLPDRKGLYFDPTNVLGFGYQTIFCFFSPRSRGSQTKMLIYIISLSLDQFMLGISQNNWSIEEQTFLSIDTQFQPGSDTTTRGIRIRATSKHAYLMPHEQENTFLYSYSIRISAGNTIQPGKRYKLQSRTWIITSDNPEVQEIFVQGAGVVGKFPEIYQGCEDFIYESCTNLEGFTGIMKGSFTFVDMDTQETFECTINPFSLRPEKEAKLISFDLEKKQAEILFETQK